MNDEIGNSMVGWINSANPEKCELEGSIWFPALGGGVGCDALLAVVRPECADPMRPSKTPR